MAAAEEAAMGAAMAAELAGLEADEQQAMRDAGEAGLLAGGRACLRWPTSTSLPSLHLPS